MERPGSLGLTIGASLVLAFSLAFAALLLAQGISNATMVTCDGPPPEAWRRSVAYVGFAFALVLDLGGAGLVVRGGNGKMVIAIGLALAAVGASIVALLIPALAAGLC